MNSPVDLDHERARRPRPLNVRSVSVFDGKEVPHRRWVVPGFSVEGGITLFAGDGGTGKSLLMIQLQVAAALGEPWLGMPMPEPFSTFGFYCEDDEDELHRRFHDACRHYGCSFGDLGDSVRFISRVGEPNELMTFDRRSDAGKPTALLSQIENEVALYKPRLCVFDTVADVFGGNENIRPQVRAFVTRMRRLALIGRGAVILTAHPSRSGMADGSGQSGSTAWQGSVRARAYLKMPHQPDQDIDGEPEPTNERLLKLMKSNYGPQGDKIRLKWQDGVFLRTDIAGPGSLADQYDDDKKVLDGATWLIERGAKLGAIPKARGSLASMLKDLPSCKLISFRNTVAAQERLIASGKLVLVEIGPPSKRVKCVRPAHLKYPGEAGGETEESIPPANREDGP